MKKIGFYIISFIEGFSLMAFQLIISRILASGFGTTLNVWAVLLSSTLMGLGLGYLVGGKLADSNKNPLKMLKLNLGLILLLFLFFISMEKSILQFSMGIPNVFGIIIFGILGIVPISFLLGMVTPIIISQVDKMEIQHNGSVAGKLYANSTLGGIVGTFLFGLVFIPEHGLWISSLILSILSASSFSLLWLYKN